MHHLVTYFKNLGIDPNVTISLSLSLATFCLAFLFNWVSRLIGRHRENKWYRKSFLFTLQNFSRSCRLQHKKLTESLETASLLANRNFEVKAVPIASIDYLAKTDFNRFIMAFHPRWYYGRKRSDRYISMISRLFQLIEMIKSQEEGVKNLMGHMSENYRRHEQSYVNNLQNVHSVIGDIVRHSTFEGMQFDQRKTIMQEYTDVLNTWVKEGAKVGYLNTYDQIVLPILALNNKYPITDFTEKTNRAALECQLAYINIKKIDEYLHSNISIYTFNHYKAAKMATFIGSHL